MEKLLVLVLILESFIMFPGNGDVIMRPQKTEYKTFSTKDPYFSHLKIDQNRLSIRRINKFDVDSNFIKKEDLNTVISSSVQGLVEGIEKIQPNLEETSNIKLPHIKRETRSIDDVGTDLVDLWTNIKREVSDFSVNSYDQVSEKLSSFWDSVTDTANYLKEAIPLRI